MSEDKTISQVTYKQILTLLDQLIETSIWHIDYYTKKPGLSPALSQPFYFIFISLGLCLFFLLNVSRKTPFFRDASAVDKSAFSGTW